LDEDGICRRRGKEEGVTGDQVSVFDVAGVGGKRKTEKCGNRDISHDGLVINVQGGF
jgi:hypothetical protein